MPWRRCRERFINPVLIRSLGRVDEQTLPGWAFSPESVFVSFLGLPVASLPPARCESFVDVFCGSAFRLSHYFGNLANQEFSRPVQRLAVARR